MYYVRSRPSAPVALPRHGCTAPRGDRLCRQIGFPIRECKLFREIELTSIEGTNPAPASHSQHAASQTRKRPQCALFRVSNRIGNGQLVEDLALPSFARTAQAPHTHAAKFARARPTAPFAWNGRLACWSNAHGHPALHPCMTHHASHTHIGAHASCSQEQRSGSWWSFSDGTTSCS